jgi:hypothetical protein
MTSITLIEAGKRMKLRIITVWLHCNTPKTTPTKIDTITGVIKYSTNIDKSTGKP